MGVATTRDIAEHAHERIDNLYKRLGEILRAIEVPSSAEEMSDHIGCYLCGRRYGDEYGFPDLVIPNEDWVKISPNHDEGGLLCPSCVCHRLEQEGITTTGMFTSGPLNYRTTREAYCKAMCKICDGQDSSREEKATFNGTSWEHEAIRFSPIDTTAKPCDASPIRKLEEK